MSEDRRRVPRYSVHVKGTITLPGESTVIEVTLEDMSLLGCLLESAPSLKLFQECEFSMVWRGLEFRTPALVAWKGGHNQAGLAFHDTDPVDKQVLREICPDLFMKPLRRLKEDEK